MIKVKFKNSRGVMGSRDLRRTAAGLERVHLPESAREGAAERRSQALDLDSEGREQEVLLRS